MGKRFAAVAIAFSFLFLMATAVGYSQDSSLRVQWLGQACFLVRAQLPNRAKPFRFLWDPYNAKVGYPVQRQQADVVFVSHFHFDHDNIEMAPGAQILYGLTDKGASWNLFRKVLAPQVSLETVGAYHDPFQGSVRGLNSVSILTVNGIRLVHLGDLGHLLTEEQIQAIGRADVLFLPVGGVFTIDGNEAKKVVEQLHPKLIIPMHYKTPLNQIPLQSVSLFLQGSPWPVKQLKTDTLVLEQKRLPKQTEVVVLTPSAESQSPPYRL